jgi:glutathione synthase/RimK-type ligase-like ATP-grasp enzyme
MIPVFGDTGRLRDIEGRLAARPGDAGLLLERACELDALGRTEEARDAYVEVIKRDPSQLRALTNLGTLLFNAGYRSAARLTYAEAVKHHPHDPSARVNLGNALLENNQLEEAKRMYESALEIDATFAAAHQGLSYVLARTGGRAAAEHHRRLGFGAAPIAVTQYRGSGVPVGVLLLVSAIGGNVSTELAIDDREALTVKLFADYYDPSLPLPPHDVIFNAIGDAELCERALDVASRLVKKSTAPVINPPQRVAQTSRVEIARRLAGVEGLLTARTERVRRAALRELDMRAPFLLRSPGYHTGEHFVFVGDANEVERAAAALPGDELLALEYLDSRGADGSFRKYRVLFIGGKLFPLHLARSTQWKVHYFTADLAATPEAIAEETAFLTNVESAIGCRAVRALEEVQRRLGLDYAGADFGLDPSGNVLLFEANAAMKIVPPAPHDPSEVRREAAARALGAMRALISRSSASTERRSGR